MNFEYYNISEIDVLILNNYIPGFCVGDVESLSSKMGRKCLRKSTYLTKNCGIEEDDYETLFDCVIMQALLLEDGSYLILTRALTSARSPE